MMKSTRERILQTLLNNPWSTINELAEAVDINAISVRHHLSSLQAEGLVTAKEERHGVGRPRLVYYLTENGMEQFPKRYLSLTSRLIKQLKESLPESTVEDIFKQMAVHMSENSSYKPDGSIEKKLDLLIKYLSQEGYSVEYEKQGNQYEIYVNSCPYLHLSQDHPEVCSIDETLISAFLSKPVNRISCVNDGDSQCAFCVSEFATEK